MQLPNTEADLSDCLAALANRRGVFELAMVAEDYPLLRPLLAIASTRGVQIAQLRTRGPVLRSAALAAALRRYATRRPFHVSAPFFGLIQIEAELDGLASYDTSLARIVSALSSVAHLQQSYALHVAFRLALSFADAAGLRRLCRSFVRVQSHGLYLDLSRYDAARQLAPALGRELDLFLDTDLARRLDVTLGGLPFCLVSPRHFRYVLANQARQRRGDALAQMRDIAAMKESRTAPLSACATCRRIVPCYAESRVAQRPKLHSSLAPCTEPTVVFVGSSLTAKARARLAAPDQVFARPAEQGDVFSATLDGFANVVLIDGELAERIPLSTFEVMVALYAGVNVFGSAELGALRARELDRFGMRALGYVYDYLRSQRIVPYHVVARRRTEDGRALSEPLINLRYFLDRASLADVVSRVEADEMLSAIADAHYSGLSFSYLFKEAKRQRRIDGASLRRLRRFFDREGEAAFDVQARDASQLLTSYRDWLARDGTDFVPRTIASAMQRNAAVLKRLYGKSRPLPETWNQQLVPGRVGRRERALSETLATVEEFLEELDTTIADTSGIFDVSYHMLSIVFVPFLHFSYPISSSSGFGPSFRGALGASWMELFERLSMLDTDFGERRRFRSLARVRLDPNGRLTSRGSEDRFLASRDIMTGSVGRLTYEVATTSGSTGLASGNTLLEAIVCGIMECIERDVTTVYKTNLLRQRGEALVLDPRAHGSQAYRTIVKRVVDMGAQVRLWWRPNVYDLPVVEACVCSNGQLFWGSGCAFSAAEAIEGSFFEALGGLVVTYAGARDDMVKLLTPVVALDHLMRPRRALRLPVGLPRERPLTTQLGVLKRRLRAAGRRHAWVVNLSPQASACLATVKVIIPGLELPEAQGGVRHADFEAKIRATLDLVERWRRRATRRTSNSRTSTST